MDAGSLFLQQLINGLSLGSVYALIALGYTMVYGIVKLINFAHGDIIMVGAYAAQLLLTGLGLPLYLSVPIALLGAIAVVVILIIRKSRKKHTRKHTPKEEKPE